MTTLAAVSVVETLSNLVRIPSVNPMGRDVQGPEYFEGRVTDWLENWFQQLGVASERQTAEPGRDNILACLPGDGTDQILMFEAHQDTVPVDGMTIEPWSGEVREGRVWGRGSCDIKGGMAAMLTAFARLAANRPTPRPTVLMACSFNEEHGFTGAVRIAEHLVSHGSVLVSRLPDAAVVAEPTLLNVVITHKGAVRWKCHTHGRAAHSSQPANGDNAIYRMARVLPAWEELASALAQGDRHPLLGTATLSVGLIEGGISVNTVPDQCTIEIDRRVLPGESPQQAYQQAVAALQAGLPDTTFVHDPPYLAAPGLEDTRNGDLALLVAKASQAHGGPGELIGVPYGTDAPAFDGCGIPSVVFGPGSITQAHTCDEWIAIDELEKAVECYYQLASQPLTLGH